MTKKWRENIERYKAEGSKVNNRMRQEIIRPKSSWWTQPVFQHPESGTPPLELARMRHNTQGINASESY